MANWNADDTSRLRAEVERRFRERTPAMRIDEVDFGTRVSRAELRNWCSDALGKEFPEMDVEFYAEHIRWSRDMMKRVVKEQDPDDYKRLLTYWKGDNAATKALLKGQL